MLLLFLIPKGADAVTVSPLFHDYSLNPGDTILDVIKVYNESEMAETFYPIRVNFSAGKEEAGVPQFYPADENRAGQALAPWIQVDLKAISLGPNERANIPFSINVPQDAQPGGHYGAIMLSTSPSEAEGGEVGIASQLATLLLMRVSGEVREVGSIAEFGFEDPQVWYNHLPAEFFLRFENSGNTHLRPAGNLLIYNWWGRQVASIEVNGAFKSVLPNSIRRYKFGWHKRGVDEGANPIWNELNNFAFGKYQAQLVLNYGTSNQVVTAVREFTVWPWRVMSVFGVLVFILLILLWFMKRLYDKRLFKRYERMMEGRQ